MEISVEKPKEWQRIFEIKTTADKVKEREEVLFKKYKKRVTIPGFRKGKVPENILRKKIGDSILQEAINDAIAYAYIDALKEKKINPLTKASIDNVKFNREEGLSFSATFEIIPEIPIADYKGMEINLSIPQVEEEDIDRVIEDMRNANAVLIPVVRGAVYGDYILTDYEIMRERKGILRSERVNNFGFISGSEQIPEAMTQKMLGVRPGDRRNVEIEYSTDFPDKSLAGRELKYTFYIKEVKERKLPIPDDEFAKDMGFANLQTLREHIRAELNKDRNETIKRKTRVAIINRLISQYQFEPPNILIKSYLDDIKERLKNENSNENLDKEIYEAAVWQAKREVILERVATAEEIKINDKELEEKIKKSEVKDKLSDKDYREFLRSHLRREKALDFLAENANIRIESEAKRRIIHPRKFFRRR